MIKKLPIILTFISALGFGQAITVSNTTYTPEQLVTDVLSGYCATISNVTYSSTCGIGYFNANGSGFPFSEGMVLRNGNVNLTTGVYTGTNVSSLCNSNSGDADLQQILINRYGSGAGQINDVTWVKFNIIPDSDLLSFNFIFASNEYGQYQCGFSDAIGFILTDIETGVKTNMAVIPGTTIPVSVPAIRENAYNAGCPDANPAWFSTYNVGNTSSTVNMRGFTVPMTASANVIPGHQYSLKLAVGDNNDFVFDSAVFIEAGGLFSGSNCAGRIKMTAFVDANENGTREPNEQRFSKGSFSYQKNNTGNSTQILAGSENTYIVAENTPDTYDLDFTVNPEYAGYYSASASFSDISFSTETSNNYYFPVINTQPYSDVSVSLLPFQAPRPGFAFKTIVVYTNNGTSATSGSLTFTKDDAVTISGISEAGAAMLPTGFTLDFTNLLPFETRSFNVTMQTPTLPVVALGDMLQNSIAISSTLPDFNVNDNASQLSQIIVGSFDPNDKAESHAGEVDINTFDSNDYLNYTIRFQNEGTASAITVKIDDVLDAALDETSLRMIGSSHDYRLTRTGNNLSWTFDAIHLPGKLENETQSHGYVHFKIKPKAGFSAGDVIPNTASIYFDFNPPIETNTVNTTFVALSTQEEAANRISVYPNPTHSFVTIATNSSETIQSLKIIDVTGKNVLENRTGKPTETLNISKLKSGMYLIEITTSSQLKLVRKLIVK